MNKSLRENEHFLIKRKKRLSNFIPCEPLSKNEKFFLAFCFIVYFGWSIVFLNKGYGPDETMRYDVPMYIYKHLSLPFGNEAEIVNSYWGMSYGYSIMFPYLLSAAFMKTVSFFTQSPNVLWIAARFTSVISGIGVVFYAMCIARSITNKSIRWVFIIPLSLMPQMIFIFSYCNLDSFGLFTAVFLLYLWIYGMKNKWDIKSCFWLGIGIGLCFLSYPFAYPFIFGSFLVYCIWHILHFKETSFKKFIGHGAIVLLLVFVVSGWYFIRNAFLYNGDIFALNASTPYAEKLAAPEMKPSVRSMQTMRATGYSIFGMLKNTPWIKMTFYSMFYGLGYMTIFASEALYEIIFVIICIGAAGCVLSLIKGEKISQDTVVCSVVLIIVSIITVLLSLYYSWSSDYQPQGRYIITCLPLIYAIVAYGIYNITKLLPQQKKVQRCICIVVFLAVMFVDFKATYDCLKNFVY